MTNDTTYIIKNIWRTNKLGSWMFIIGMILFIVGIICSIIWKLNLSSSPDNISYVVTAIGIGIPFIFTGINIILNPIKENIMLTIRERNNINNCTNYIGENKILSIGWMASTIFIILFFMSYPKDWYYPQIYIIYIFYVTGISLLIISTFLNTANVIAKLKRYDRIIKDKEEMCKEETIPDYIIEFANNLKKNIDGATANLSEKTVSSIKKYKSDNEQLRNDVQNFKQRIEKEKGDYKKYANERIIKSLMKMFYNIDYALKYKDNKDINNMINHVEGIKRDLHNILVEEEIEIINPTIGENFDDTKCCAIQVIETDKLPDNKIMEVKKLGYKFKSGKVICADVAVSKNNSDKKSIIEKVIDKDEQWIVDKKSIIEKVIDKDEQWIVDKGGQIDRNKQDQKG